MIGSIPVTFWPGLLIALALLIASSWFLVRHTGLAVFMALSPLPGFVLVASGSEYLPSFFDYLPGFIAAGFLAAEIASVAANVPVRQAVQQALRDLWPAFLAAFLLFAPVILLGGEALCCMAGEISAIAVTALGAMLLSYNEDFVVRINRAIEARVRETERLDFLTQPRWGMSIGGITLVLSALGFFGAQKSLAMVSSHSVLFASEVFVFLVGALAVTCNVRRALAAILAMAPVTLLMFALSDRFMYSAIPFLPLAMSAIPVFFMAASALGFAQSGGSWEVATQLGIARFAPTVAITVIAGASAAILSGLLSQPAIIGSISLFLGGAAALILQPALTTMLYALFSKRISLDEAFRKR